MPSVSATVLVPAPIPLSAIFCPLATHTLSGVSFELRCCCNCTAYPELFVYPVKCCVDVRPPPLLVFVIQVFPEGVEWPTLAGSAGDQERQGQSNAPTPTNLLMLCHGCSILQYLESHCDQLGFGELRHGFRRSDQMMEETESKRTANANVSGASITIMKHLLIREGGYMFTFCSM